MSGTDRLSLLQKHGRDSSTNHTLIRKLSRMLSPDLAFSIYKINERMPIESSAFANVTFSARDYVNIGAISVKGRIRAIELAENFTLIVIEFSSRSSYYRRFYRYLIGPTTFFVEEKEGAISLFQELVQPLLIVFDYGEYSVLSEHFERTFQTGYPVVEIEFEIADEKVEHLNRIKLTGDNLARGVKTLRSRQEVDVVKISNRVIALVTSQFTLSIDNLRITKMTPDVIAAISKIFETPSTS